jgi:hypothetical protein
MKILVIGEGYEFMATIERIIDFDLDLFGEFVMRNRNRTDKTVAKRRKSNMSTTVLLFQ